MRNCECGAELLKAIGEETIRTTTGDARVFRRENDYVICPECLTAYSVVQLRRSTLPDPQMQHAAALFEELGQDEGEPIPLEDLFDA